MYKFDNNCFSFLLVAIFLYALLGCENTTNQQEPPVSQGMGTEITEENLTTGSVGQIQLNWIGHWKGEAGRQDLIEAVKKDYEFLHPEVQVNLTYNVDLPGQNKNHKLRVTDTIIDMIETGQIEWDIVYLDISVYEHISEKLGSTDWVREHLVDFREVEGFAETQKRFIITNPRYRERMGGILSGPFFEGYIQNPWFNAELANKIGIKVKERGMKLEDLLEYARALHNYNKKHNSTIPFIKLCTWNRLELFFETFFRSQFDDFSSATKEVFNEQKKVAFLKTLNAFEELAQYQPILNADWEQLNMADYIKEFILNDDGLFITGGTYMYGHFYNIDAQESIKLRPAETPVMGKKNGLMADFTPTFAVMKKGSHRKIAEDFLLFMAKPEYAERWVSKTKSPTGIKGHLAEFAMQSTDVYEKFAMDMQKKYDSTTMVSLRNPTYVFGKNSPVTINELRFKLARILEGRLTAKQFYEEVVARLENVPVRPNSDG